MFATGETVGQAEWIIVLLSFNIEQKLQLVVAIWKTRLFKTGGVDVNKRTVTAHFYS